MTWVQYVDFVIHLEWDRSKTGDQEAVTTILNVDDDYRTSQQVRASVTASDICNLSGSLVSFTREQALLIGELLMPPRILEEFQRLRRSERPIRVVVMAPNFMQSIRWEAAMILEGSRLATLGRVSIVRRKTDHPEPRSLFSHEPKIYAWMDATKSMEGDGQVEIASDCRDPDWIRAKFGGEYSPHRVEASKYGIDAYEKSISPTAIFHFSGHGTLDGGVFIPSKVKNDDPDQWISAKITKALMDHKVQLAVVSACRSGGGANSSLLELSRHIADAIPAVVGMQDVVRSDTAKRFIGAMFDRLGDGDDLEQAVLVGRQLLGEGDGFDFAIPVLYLQVSGDTRMVPDRDEGVLVAEPEPAVDRDPEPEFAPVVNNLDAPPLAVRVQDRLWWIVEVAGDVRLRDAGELTERIYPPPPESLGVQCVISADGQTIARIVEDRLEWCRLRVAADGGLGLSSAREVKLPSELKGARLLSIRAVNGLMLIIVSDEEQRTVGLTFRGERWSTAHLLSNSAAIAAADTPHGITIAFANGGVDRPEGPGGGFPGFVKITGIASASTTGSSLVLVSGHATDKGERRFRLERRTGSAVSEADVDPTTPNGYIVLARDPSGRGVAVLSLDPQSGLVAVIGA